MQNLQARFGKCVVKSGPLAGTTFDAVAPDRLRKAAKRYSGDPEFQKYAKSFVLLEDLREVEKEPEPCALCGSSQRTWCRWEKASGDGCVRDFGGV